MLKWFTTLWVVGLLSLVPYSIWYLLFEATRDEYAFYIVLPLFWVFGYWGVIGPLLSAWKVHQFMNALGRINNRDELMKLIQSEDSKEAALELIASENNLPKFIARRIYSKLVTRLSKNRPA